MSDEPHDPDDHHRRIHHLALRLEEIVSSFRLIAIEWEIEQMDFSKLDTAVADIKTEIGNLSSNEAAAVAKAVADAQAADQAELDAKVASDLTPAALGFPAPPAPAPETAAEEAAATPAEETAEGDPQPAA